MAFSDIAAERPALPAGPRALVLINENAGGVGPGARARVEEVLLRLGAPIVAVADDVAHLGALARSEPADVAIVLGGDGTARAAAEMMARPAGPLGMTQPPPLVLLPGGTLNVLPRALYGSRPWPEALEAALSNGRVVRLAGGQANHQHFFVAAFLGDSALFARAREAARRGQLLSALRRARVAMKALMSSRRAARPTGGAAARVEAVGVLCPAYSGSCEGRDLEWVHLNAATLPSFMRVTARAVLGGWREDSAIEVMRCRGGEVRRRGLIPAILDGEPTTFESPVRIAMLRRGPRVLVVR